MRNSGTTSGLHDVAQGVADVGHRGVVAGVHHQEEQGLALEPVGEDLVALAASFFGTEGDRLGLRSPAGRRGRARPWARARASCSRSSVMKPSS